MSVARGESDGVNDGPLIDGLPSLITAAHELKSPLALIRQLSLSLEGDDLKPLQRQRVIDQISLTSERALRLTSDLTRSINLSDAMFQLEPVNPCQLCEDIVKELKPLYQAYDRDIKLKSRKHPLLLVGNRDLLRRIMINFGDNALHYASADSPIEIQIGLRNNGQTVRLGVRDYGPALGADVKKRLKNSQPVASINARPQSSGLGLYISRQFADAMNGRIGFIQHRDGSTFYVDLQASHQLSLL